MAGRPLAPAGLGEDQVPEASITARANRRLSPPLASVTRSSKGWSSRPAVRTLPLPTRATPVTRTPRRSRAAISGTWLNGSR
jgi:hypothetical protein